MTKIQVNFLKSIKLNVKGYLIKPFDVDSLFDILKNHKFLQTIIDHSYESIMVIKDSLARIGGDEFTLIVESIRVREDALKLAKKLLDAIEVPINYENNILNLSASIGISIYPDDSTTSKTLLKYADMAMFRAKQSKTNIMYYSDIKKI